MSMPEFPEVDCDLTIDRSLAMILSSIAMEELALSHIINAESEKLEYVLKKNACLDHCVILEINKSVGNILDKVLENQLLLKNKMEKVLDKIEYIPICVKPCSTLCNDNCSTNCNYNEECKLKYKEICKDCVKSLLEKKNKDVKDDKSFSSTTMLKTYNYNWKRNCPLELMLINRSCIKFNLKRLSRIIIPPGEYDIFVSIRFNCLVKECININLCTSCNVKTMPSSINIMSDCETNKMSGRATIIVPNTERNGELKLVLTSHDNVFAEEIEIFISKK